MDWKEIKTNWQYKSAAKRLMEIFHAKPGTPESDELDRLLMLVKDYENKRILVQDVNAL